MPQRTLMLFIFDLDFKVLALGIVNEEGEVFLPHRFIGFVSNLKEMTKYQLCDILCGKELPRLCLFIYCVWKLRMTLIKLQDIYLLSMCYYILIVKVFKDGDGPRWVREINC